MRLTDLPLDVLTAHLPNAAALALRASCRELHGSVWLREPVRKRLVFWLGRTGSVEALLRLHRAGQLRPLWNDAGWAAALTCHLVLNGQPIALALLHRMGCPYCADECELAAQCGCVASLASAVGAGFAWCASWSVHAAVRGKRAILEWAHGAGLPLHEDTCAACAEGGHFTLLTWARGEAGCPWGPAGARVCRFAARDGELDVLRWARQDGCPWDASACEAAAESGHLDVLDWAVSHGCDWGEDTLSAAAAAGKLNTLKWAVSQPSAPLLSARVFAAGAQSGSYRVLQWLLDQNCPRNSATFAAAAWMGDIDTLEWLYAHEFPADETAMQSALQTERWEALEWLERRGFSAWSDWDSDRWGELVW